MPDLPTGTVTILFTDIEGSTRLWQEQPDAMRLALARHDAVLRAAIETNNGHVFKTMGDAFCAAFPVAADAGLAIQQSLQQPLFADAFTAAWAEGRAMTLQDAILCAIEDGASASFEI
jgi:class 3 adenylate cyclase